MTIQELSAYFARIQQTSSRNAITEILSQLFRYTTIQEIAPICYMVQGRVSPGYTTLEFGIAEKFMIRAIASAYGKTQEHVLAAYKQSGDLGDTAAFLHHQTNSGTPSVMWVYDQLTALAHAGGQGSQEDKIQILSGILGSIDKTSSRYLVRMTLDKLRLGFSDMTVLDALSWMETGTKSQRDELERAYNIRPDIGYIAAVFKKSGIKGLSRVRATIGVPILAALCQRLPTADEMIAKMEEVNVEPKYDGMRVQIHASRSDSHAWEVSTFSRNLENTTAMFPELTTIGSAILARNVILDAEAVGVNPETGVLIPFQETMTRKRKHGIAKASDEVPLRFVVFDILYKDGNDLLALPLVERKRILHEVVVGKGMLVNSSYIVTKDVEKLRAYHDKQLACGLEGVVVKKWSSAYEPGRRGFTWVKFKEEEGKIGKLNDTIDTVVMGYYRGKGKRTGFGIGALLVGVRKGDQCVTITKIGTGVSDEQWKELVIYLEKNKVKTQPKAYAGVHKVFTPDVWVMPTLVVEIAGDDLTKSPTHGAGIAVRFPRLVRIRTDRSAGNATTLEEVKRMYGMQNAEHKK